MKLSVLPHRICRPFGLTLLFLFLVAAPLRAAGDPEGIVHSLGGDLYAGGAAPGAASQPEVRERLDAGLPVAFTYHFLFSRPRHFWFSKTVGERQVVRTALYDRLSALYRLETRIGDEPPRIEFARERGDAENFLEHFDALDLGPAGMDRPTAAGLRASLKVHFLAGTMLLLPWSLETGWREIALVAEPGG
jgi:hypothetical protein